MNLQRLFQSFIVILIAAISFFPQPAKCGTFAVWDLEKLVLDNGAVKRVISLSGEEQGISTSSLTIAGYEKDFVQSGSREFYLEINDAVCEGVRNWEVTGCRLAFDGFRGNGATLTLQGLSGKTADIEIEVTYLLYPELPVIRKKLAVINRGQTDLKVEAVDVEHLLISWGDTHSWIMNNYARDKRLGPFIGTWDDPAVTIHDIRGRRGILLGSEAPGVTKRTSAFLDGRSVTIGLTRPDQTYPFRKWLEPGEQWESPWIFIALYHGTNDPYKVLNGPVNDFVRRHMGFRLAVKEEKPVFVYNTWNPFRTNVSENLVKELAEAAAACGVEEFIIDDGWQTNYGDWEIDRGKFPNGLKPVFDHIRSLGMKPGLWLSLASAEKKSRVFQEHPEWFIVDREGNPGNLHDTRSMCTGCLATGWYDHIKSVLLNLVKEYGLAYCKLDLAIVTSSYVYDRSISGCRAKDHPLHRDREESFLVNYRRCMDLFDELHEEVPELFIDCTFETWGPLQNIDYALVKHAEGDWLVNIEEPVPYGSMRVRNLAWSRSPSIPAGAMVIGNLTLDDPNRELGFLSLAGSLPIMLGDPRKVADDDRRRLKRWADWMRDMQKKHDYMLFRQDLPGFGEPFEGQWDGWARINNDTYSGGIVGVFRQGGVEEERTVTVNGLETEKIYTVRGGPDGREIVRMSGQDLAGKGFSVRLSKPYDAALFEIDLIM